MSDLFSLNFNDSFEVNSINNNANECLGNCDCPGESSDCINDCDCRDDCN